MRDEWHGIIIIYSLRNHQLNRFTINIRLSAFYPIICNGRDIIIIIIIHRIITQPCAFNQSERASELHMLECGCDLWINDCEDADLQLIDAWIAAIPPLHRRVTSLL